MEKGGAHVPQAHDLGQHAVVGARQCQRLTYTRKREQGEESEGEMAGLCMGVRTRRSVVRGGAVRGHACDLYGPLIGVLPIRPEAVCRSTGIDYLMGIE